MPVEQPAGDWLQLGEQVVVGMTMATPASSGEQGSG
jgi:hypothetical protein